MEIKRNVRILKSRKGITPVVATVLVLAITFAAVVIVAQFIVPLVSDNLDSSTECVEFDSYFYFEDDFGFNCYEPIYDDSGENVIRRMYGISIGSEATRKELEDDVAGFLISFAGAGSSKGIEVEEGKPTDKGDEGMRMLDLNENFFSIPKIGEVRTYVYNTSVVYNFTQVRPVLKNGRVCDASDSISLRGEICGSEKDIP